MTIHKNSSRNVHLTYHQTNSPQKKVISWITVPTQIYLRDHKLY